MVWLGVFIAVFALIYGISRTTAGGGFSGYSHWKYFDSEELHAAACKYGVRLEIVGTGYENRGDTIATLERGAVLRLVREPHNRFDHNAVAVHAKSGSIGYLSRDDAQNISVWLDGGERVGAYLASIGGGPDHGRDEYRVWIYVLSVDRLSDLRRDQEHKTAAGREERQLAKLEADARGWEKPPPRQRKTRPKN